MRIVIDTNVLISAVFFGGKPRKVVEAVVHEQIQAFASHEILTEYREIMLEMAERKKGKPQNHIFHFLAGKLEIVEPVEDVHICRDPDDDKFISCAVEAKALYIVSRDKDLLDIREYKGIEMITAAAFCERFLSH